MDEVDVKVVFFAKARELIGRSSSLTRLPAHSSPEQLRELLVASFPALLKVSC